MLRRYGLVKLKSPRDVALSFRNRGRVTFGHMAIGPLIDLGLVLPSFVETAFKFALSRDPYARAISLYNYLSTKSVLRNWHEQPDFRNFLRLLADGHYDRIGAYNSRGLSQCSPQVDWLRDTPADKVYRIETPEDFLSEISEHWKILKGALPHENPSVLSADFELSREERSLIDKIYAEDFEVLGYSKRQSAIYQAGR
jgi:hypothetical protein